MPGDKKQCPAFSQELVFSLPTRGKLGTVLPPPDLHRKRQHPAFKAEAQGALFGFLPSDVKSIFPGKCFLFPRDPPLINREKKLQRHTMDFYILIIVSKALVCFLLRSLGMCRGTVFHHQFHKIMKSQFPLMAVWVHAIFLFCLDCPWPGGNQQ